VLPRFEVVHRARPVRLVAGERETGFVAPFAAVEAELATHDVAGRVTLGFSADAGVRLHGWYDGGRRLAGLDVTDSAGRTTHHRSRRHGRPDTPPDALAATLTGSWLTVLTRVGGTWTARGRVDLDDRLPGSLPTGLVATTGWTPRERHGPSPVARTRSGTFGQLGLRDCHFVTHADGRPFVRDGLLQLTMTHAGPGFLTAGHTGVWSYDPATHALAHTGDLYFRRTGRVLGDHATHLVRHEGRWLVATSTWADFDGTGVGIELAESGADLLRGEHVVEGTPVELPVADLPGGCVGVWDPHLALVDGHWYVAFVAARKFFSFRPALARAAEPGRLSGFELCGVAEDRTATEGTVMAHTDDGWRVLASDGRDNPRRVPAGFAVFDLRMRQVGRLDATYPTNIPWPNVVPWDGGWLMVTFDGSPYGGPLPGYGTHGDVVVLRAEGALRPGPAPTAAAP
jgi:hypothetical protein